MLEGYLLLLNSRQAICSYKSFNRRQTTSVWYTLFLFSPDRARVPTRSGDMFQRQQCWRLYIITQGTCAVSVHSKRCLWSVKCIVPYISQLNFLDFAKRQDIFYPNNCQNLAMCRVCCSPVCRGVKWNAGWDKDAEVSGARRVCPECCSTGHCLFAQFSVSAPCVGVWWRSPKERTCVEYAQRVPRYLATVGPDGGAAVLRSVINGGNWFLVCKHDSS